jgi:hypothetical protein
MENAAPIFNLMVALFEIALWCLILSCVTMRPRLPGNTTAAWGIVITVFLPPEAAIVLAFSELPPRKNKSW